MNSERKPSIKQLVNRMNSGHYRALCRLAEGQTVANGQESIGDLRGYMTVCATLQRWGALGNGRTLTETGAALKAAYEARYGK